MRRSATLVQRRTSDFDEANTSTLCPGRATHFAPSHYPDTPLSRGPSAFQSSASTGGALRGVLVPSAFSVKSTGDIPVVCAADFARRCYVRERGQAALRPLADGEQLVGAGAAVTYELVPGNTGRFVGASLADCKFASVVNICLTVELVAPGPWACQCGVKKKSVNSLVPLPGKPLVLRNLALELEP